MFLGIQLKAQWIIDIASWFNGFEIEAVTTWPFIIYGKETISERILNHERIHIAQQTELLVVGSWLLYPLFYYLGKLKGKTNYEAYASNPFEREAFDNDRNIYYLVTRKPFAWLQYLSLR